MDEAHTYFVGDGQWLVHNCPPSDTPNNNKKSERFVRYGSEAEVNEIIKIHKATGKWQLSFPTSGTGNRREKWIALVNAMKEKVFGKPEYYTHQIVIHTRPGTINWLNNPQHMLDEEVFQLMNKPNHILVLTKTNEPGRFGLTREGLEEFNDKIVLIEITRVRKG